MDYYDLPEAERRRLYENSPRGRDEKTIFGDVQTPRTAIEAMLEDMLDLSRRIPLLESLERQERSIYPQIWDLMRLKPAQRRKWLKCRLSVHLGYLDRTIPRLEAIHRWLLWTGDLAAIALCSIDLALAYAKRGDVELRIPGLLNRLADQMEAAENPWAPGALT